MRSGAKESTGKRTNFTVGKRIVVRIRFQHIAPACQKMTDSCLLPDLISQSAARQTDAVALTYGKQSMSYGLLLQSISGFVSGGGGLGLLCEKVIFTWIAVLPLSLDAMVRPLTPGFDAGVGVGRSLSAPPAAICLAHRVTEPRAF